MNNITRVVQDFFERNPYATTHDAVKKFGCSGRTARRAKHRARKNKYNPIAPKILVFDIETTPMEVLVWGLYKQRIPPDNVIKEWSVLSWAGKWLFESKVMSNIATPDEAKNREDGRIVKSIWDLLNEADIVIAHNAKRFDVRRLNARFIVNGLQPPLPYQVIDTLKETQKLFAFSSHKLDAINRVLGLTQKIDVDYNLWKQCIAGDELALKRMERYNRQDVIALEELYAKIRPWIKSHPNLGLYYDIPTTVCPNCGSQDITWEGYYYTPMGRYETYRCSCGAIGRSRVTDIDKDQRKLLGSSIAR